MEGVDVLFIGPLDLSVSLGIVGDFEHPDFRSALQKVAAAAQKAGKAAGILLRGPEDLERVISDGFTFLGDRLRRRADRPGNAQTSRCF